MKHRTFAAILALEALLCLALCFAQEALPTAFTALMAFPFEQIGLLLRALSLLSRTGNLASIFIYAALCLSPVAVWLLVKKRRGRTPEDGLLWLLGALLFAVLFLMINPGLIDKFLGLPDMQQIGKALLGGMIYSVLIGYGILRLLRASLDADMKKLHKYLAALLYALGALLVYLAFGAGFAGLLGDFSALASGNVGNERLLGTSYVFLVLRYLLHVLPYVLNVLVVFHALSLLFELHADRYSQAAVTAAQGLATLCRLTLTITVLSNIGLNLAQLLFAQKLRVINGSVQIPLLSVGLMLLALFLARLIEENKRLKDDNDMFI